MAEVVQLGCPGCKQPLRVPSDWLDQPMRCKHCGMTFQARVRATARPAVAVKAAPAKAPRPAAVMAPPPPPPPPRAEPAAILAPPVAVAVPAPPAGGGFADLDFDSSPSPRKSRPRRKAGGGGSWKGLLVGGILIVLVGVAAAVVGPRLAELAGKPPGDGSSGPVAQNNSNPDDPGKAITTEPGKTPATGVSDKKPPLLPKPSNNFPRRALVISVNNYVYLNSVNPGLDNRNSGSVFTLIERQLPLGLSIPRTQITLLSDAAKAQAAPPLKSVIEKTFTDFLETSRPQDRLVVFFVGHAVETDDEVFLVPVEGEREVPESLIPLKWVYEQLAACKACQKVLVMDVCRFNPSRGFERPTSGPLKDPEDEKLKGAMGAKLDAMLQAPPPGVQVWSACVKDQHSIEYDDGNLNNGAFLQAMADVLAQGVKGKIQKADEPIPVEALVDQVNERMRLILLPLNKKQTSRLSGQLPPDGAPYNPDEPEPLRVAVKLPQLPEGNASLNTIKAILQDVQVPPLKISKQETALKAEALPPFSAKVLADYLPDEGSTPFREAVKKAQKALTDSIKGQAGKSGIKEQFPVPANIENFNKDLMAYQRNELATVMAQLTEALQELEAAGKEGREAEMNKRWQANYDYLLARIKYQLAFLYEYQTLLGNARKSPPDYDPKVHNAWRIASIPKLQGDREGQKLARDGRKVFEQMTKEYAGTPWEVLAKRDLSLSLGLEWQPTKTE